MKAVVLLSGGIDSTTCLARAVKLYGAAEVLGLTLFYGQKHDKELESAKAVAEHYGIEHMIQDLSQVFALSNSPLLAGKGEIPEGTYADESTREANGLSKTYVPYRNGLFLSYATAIAYSVGAQVIYYGAHADDAAGNAYPDCTQEFYHSQAKAIFEGTGYKVMMEAPLIKKNKAEVVRMGLIDEAPYHLTWSCYKGGDEACGKCGTCHDRIEAFRANGMEDPIKYEA